MGRGVAAACLAIVLCHGLSLGQTPAPTGAVPGVVVPPAAPVTDVVPPAGVTEGIATGRGSSPASPGLIPGCQMWAGVEYLMFFLSGSRVPIPLVTSGISTPQTPIPAGLGDPDTQILLGNQRFNTDTYHGIRARAGIDFEGCGFGLEAIGFVFDQQSTAVGFPSVQQAPGILGIPFINAELDAEAVGLINLPGSREGSIDFKLRTNFSGYEGNLGYALNTELVDWGFVGYRYLNLTEALFMNSTFTALAAGAFDYLNIAQPIGAVGNITDSFRTCNEFYGGQFGAVKRLLYRNVAFEGRVAVGFGTTRQRVTIDGYSSLNGGAPVQGGLFAQPSNSGTFVRNEFSVIPEVGGSIFVQLCDSIVGFVGYNFLFWNNVARPGYEIDRSINLTQVPFGAFSTTAQPPQPAVQFQRSTDLIVHGLNAGIAIQF